MLGLKNKYSDESAGLVLTLQYIPTNQQVGFLNYNISRRISRSGSYTKIYLDESAGRVLTKQYMSTNQQAKISFKDILGIIVVLYISMYYCVVGTIRKGKKHFQGIYT